MGHSLKCKAEPIQKPSRNTGQSPRESLLTALLPTCPLVPPPDSCVTAQVHQHSSPAQEKAIHLLRQVSSPADQQMSSAPRTVAQTPAPRPGRSRRATFSSHLMSLHLPMEFQLIPPACYAALRHHFSCTKVTHNA